ncbi:MAG: hydroxymethylbilane synthase [Micrococcaceae bacterium]
MRKVRVGTRASKLALTQTTALAEQLAQAGGFDFELVHVKSDGDRLKASLTQIGGTGVFVTTLRQALLDGDVDIIVHSLKDLPTYPQEGIGLPTIAKREDPRDALCARNGYILETLPQGSKVGTGSPRRAAQLLSLRPDLEIVDIRGNVETRLARLEDDLDAVVLAYAGLRRLGKDAAVTEVLDPAQFIPAPGQGALAVECRADLLEHDDELNHALIAGLIACDDLVTRAAVSAERAVLATAEQGCSAPIGAYAQLSDEGLFELHAIMYPPTITASTSELNEQGLNKVARESFTGTIPTDGNVFAVAEECGKQVATELLESLEQ